ncbi:MAG: tryptophan-rich sensory protein [Xanthobacteraceae bacterium]|nr:tryptophan-rich sensory protein [Xanthobacteraceae bacterium]
MSRSIVRLLACLALVFVIAALAGLVTAPEIATWYADLAKPSWTPPRVVFPVAWTLLYGLMAVALWRLWDRAAPSPQRRQALAFFLVQLALNAAWSPVFFGLHAIDAGLAVIVVLVVALFGTVVTSARVDRLSAILLLPYLLWVVYATTLNAGILAMN